MGQIHSMADEKQRLGEECRGSPHLQLPGALSCTWGRSCSWRCAPPAPQHAAVRSSIGTMHCHNSMQAVSILLLISKGPQRQQLPFPVAWPVGAHGKKLVATLLCMGVGERTPRTVKSEDVRFTFIMHALICGSAQIGAHLPAGLALHDGLPAAGFLGLGGRGGPRGGTLPLQEPGRCARASPDVAFAEAGVAVAKHGVQQGHLSRPPSIRGVTIQKI
jgi:hypothetical protein